MIPVDDDLLRQNGHRRHHSSALLLPALQHKAQTGPAVAGGRPEGDGWPLYGALEVPKRIKPMPFQAETCLAFALGDHSLCESWTCIWPPAVTVAAATTKEIRSVNRC
uniref:Uncharacterized protein n=1 Tax=Colletotrichum fructicola (strain Nara gc5) TaxID=1213859 RepID=L2FEY8_COLFN